jgi:hypothetical protein
VCEIYAPAKAVVPFPRFSVVVPAPILVAIGVTFVPTCPEPVPVCRLIVSAVNVPPPVIVPVFPVSRLIVPVFPALIAPVNTIAPVFVIATVPPVTSLIPPTGIVSGAAVFVRLILPDPVFVAVKLVTVFPLPSVSPPTLVVVSTVPDINALCPILPVDTSVTPALLVSPTVFTVPTIKLPVFV